MDRWMGGGWMEVEGTDIIAKVTFYGARYTPEAVVKETGTKKAIA